MIISDKRRHPRKIINIPIKYRIKDKEFSANTLDLSEDGSMILVNNLVDPGEEIHIELPLSKNEPGIYIRSFVVWRKKGVDNTNNLEAWNLGIKFAYSKDAHRLKIINFIKEVELNNIVILTLDSIYANIAVTKLINKFHNKIRLLCLSQRFSKRRGSFIRQTWMTIKKSGWAFTNYLSFYLLYHNFFIKLIRFFNKLRFKKSKVATIKELAKKYSIPIYVTDDIKSNQSIEFLRFLTPDLIISANFDQKINKEIVEIPTYGCINLHWGLLPEYKGPFPGFWSVFCGAKKIGATVHYMDEKFDEGDIIHQEEIEINKNNSILSIDCHLLDIGADLLIKAVEKIETGTITRVNQKLLGNGSYYSFPTKTDLQKLRRKGIKLFSFLHYLKQINH